MPSTSTGGMINNLDLTQCDYQLMDCGHFIIQFLSCSQSSFLTGADGLSCHVLSEEDPPEEDDFEDWLDSSYFFLIFLLNDYVPLFGGSPHFSRCLPSPMSINYPVLNACTM